MNMSLKWGYSTPGGGRSRSAHETFSGSQNLSLQSQAEIEEVIGEQRNKKKLLTTTNTAKKVNWGTYFSHI